MLKNVIKVVSLVLILGFNYSILCQSIEDGWMGIKTLKTDRKTVEKILGVPKKITKFGYFNYATADFFARIDYSDPPCQDSEYSRGRYSVPGETVLEYDIILNSPIKLADFKFKKERYRKEDDPHRTNVFYYHNNEDAVSITVGIIDGIEYVGRIRFDPSPADEKKFECKKPEVVIEKPQEAKTAETPNCKKPQ